MNSIACQFDFDINDPRITLSERASIETIRTFESETNTKLSGSHKLWMSNCSNGVVIDIGNLIDILPLFGEHSAHTYCGPDPLIHLPDGLMPFASSGCGEMWAFYTKQRFRDGEYPVVWIDPGSVGGDAYVYCNSSFDRFLNINVPFLVHSENEEELPIEQASDPKVFAMSDEKANEIWKSLYEKYERGLSFETYDLFSYATNFAEIENRIAVACEI